MKSRTALRVQRAGSIYRRLLWLYPATFRRTVGAMAVETFEDRYREALNQGRLAIIALWTRTTMNVAIHGTLERVTTWRNVHPFESLKQHFVWSVRVARRSWKVSVTAMICIAIGIAAASAVLTLFSSVFWRPVPFPNADRLVRIWVDDDAASRGTRAEMSILDFYDIRERNTTLEQVVATVRSRVMFLGDDGARRVEGEAVTVGYFEIVGASPMLGRTFAADEYTPSSAPTMILAYGAWQNAFGGDPDIVGTTVNTSLRTYTVIGVMPRDFLGTIEDDLDDIEFWIPVAHDRTPSVHTRRDIGTAWTIAKLSGETTLQHAGDDMASISAYLSQTYPDVWGPRLLRIERYGENWRADLRMQSYLLMAASFVLLVVAASNVAGLFVAHSLGRQREFAIRSALGASGIRVTIQTLVETGTLAIVGSLVGVLIAPLVLKGFLSIAPDQIPDYVVVAPDRWALALSVGVIAAAGLIAGSLPALLTTRVMPGETLRASSRGNTSSRLERLSGQWIVGAEVALTTLMLMTATVLLRSYVTMKSTDLGFRTDSVLRMAVFVDQRDVASPDLLPAFYQRLRATVESYPGVDGVGLAYPVLPPGTGGETRVRFSGMAPEVREHGIGATQHGVDAAFFDVLEIPIIDGRGFNSADDATSPPVAIVSTSLATLMGGDRAIGQTIETDQGEYRVVGVARDVKFFGAVLQRPRDLDVYTPLLQSPQSLVSFAIETRGDPQDYIAPLRQRVSALAPSSPLDWINPMTVELNDHFEPSRFYVVLISTFALSALMLTTVGLGALLAYQVARQTAELGVRRALGAAQALVFRSVIGRGLRIVSLGLVVGTLATIGLIQLMGSLVSGLEGLDVVSGLVTVALIAAVAVAGSLLPARRASRVSPMEVLRGN